MGHIALDSVFKSIFYLLLTVSGVVACCLNVNAKAQIRSALCMEPSDAFTTYSSIHYDVSLGQSFGQLRSCSVMLLPCVANWTGP